MKNVIAVLVCFLAIWVAGLAEFRRPASGTCAASASCCCGDPATVDPCVCGDHAVADFPEMTVFRGLPNLVGPPAGRLLIAKTAPLAALTPRWHPALPWHAPPEQQRARLSVWVL